MGDGFADIVEGAQIADALLAQDKLHFHWGLSPAQITALANEAMVRNKASIDSVVANHKAGGPLTLDNCVKPLTDAIAEYNVLISNANLHMDVSTNEAARDAGEAAEAKNSAYKKEMWAREDLRAVLVAFSETSEAKALTGEWKRFLEVKLRDFEREGLRLEPPEAKKLQELQATILSLQKQYDSNFRADNTSLLFSPNELNGCPESFLEKHMQPDGKVKVSFAQQFDVLDDCTVAETRRQVGQICSHWCQGFSQNKPILEELAARRHERAQLLGFKTYQDYATATSMAKTGGEVQNFIADFKDKAMGITKANLAELKALKAEHEGGEPELFEWDRTFYCKLLEKKEYGVDHEAIKEYFPVDAAINGGLGIYEEVLGLKFERELSMEGAAVWSEDVKAYRATNASDGKVIGFVYLDLHEREGKYDGELCINVQDGCMLHNRWQLPVALVLTSFAKATDTKPALLSHGNIKSFLHEFGHAMHHLCSEAELNVFSGIRVEMDYLEMPSQTSENWSYQPEALRRMSHHFKTGEPLPSHMMESLLRSFKANSAIKTFGGMWFLARSAIDQAIHTSPSVDVGHIASEIWNDFMGIKAPTGSNMGPERHLADKNYGAMFYSYLWSQVYSTDVFSRFEKEGIFNPATGAAYRKEILAPGGSRDGMDSLIAFLDRKPSVDAFLKARALPTDTSKEAQAEAAACEQAEAAAQATEVRDLILDLLQDDDSDVRAGAVEAIKNLPPAAHDALREDFFSLLKHHEHDGVRTSAAQAIAASRSARRPLACIDNPPPVLPPKQAEIPEYVRALVRELESDDKDARWQAGRTLLDDPRIIGTSFVAAQMAHPNSKVRLTMIKLFGQLPAALLSANVGHLQSVVATDEKAHVRQAARNVLRKLETNTKSSATSPRGRGHC